jgi:hypothetical protein
MSERELAEAIERVQGGMTVVDATGEEIGTVAYVSMGDPGAATTRGDELHHPGDILTRLANAVAGEARSRTCPSRSAAA